MRPFMASANIPRREKLLATFSQSYFLIFSHILAFSICIPFPLLLGMDVQERKTRLLPTSI